YYARSIAENPETRPTLEESGAHEVLVNFIPRTLEVTAVTPDGLTYERFHEITKEVQRQTGKKGRELFHPIRVALTGTVSGPELEKLIPIFEEGSKLALARPVKSVAQRLHEFAAVAGFV
ncbi:MAG TPA: glutamate--tRNA ligase, partial [Terriglobales bacterium]